MSRKNRRRGARPKSTIHKLPTQKEPEVNEFGLNKDATKWTTMQNRIGQKLVDAVNAVNAVKLLAKEVMEEEGKSAPLAKAVHIATEKAFEILRNNSLATGLGRPKDPNDPYNRGIRDAEQNPEGKPLTPKEKEAEKEEPAEPEPDDEPEGPEPDKTEDGEPDDE